jgi:hypothetical protein
VSSPVLFVLVARSNQVRANNELLLGHPNLVNSQVSIRQRPQHQKPRAWSSVLARLCLRSGRGRVLGPLDSVHALLLGLRGITKGRRSVERVPLGRWEFPEEPQAVLDRTQLHPRVTACASILAFAPPCGIASALVANLTIVAVPSFPPHEPPIHQPA